jgi:hypothetical protein
MAVAFFIVRPSIPFTSVGIEHAQPCPSNLIHEGAAMNRKNIWTVGIAVWFVVLSGLVHSAQDKYTVKVPGGLAFSDFRGYETWQAIGMSRSDRAVAVILGNPAMIRAYQAGIPANGKPLPDGAKMAKIHWAPKPNEYFQETTVPGNLLNVDFMEKDSKRFADSGGWGWAAFDYDAASNTFKPATTADTPPQGNDAKCGFTCHTRAKAKDYVFTEYPKR